MVLMREKLQSIGRNCKLPNEYTEMRLSKALNAWNTPAFEETLKQEIQSLHGKLLPLQQGLSHSSYASEDNFSVVILSVSDGESAICVKTGVFYTGLTPGCSCADDPTPNNETAEYCEVEFEIDTTTAQTRVRLLTE